MANIEEKTERLQNNYSEVEKNLSEVLKTLNSSCDTWKCCLNLLKNLDKQILFTFDPESEAVQDIFKPVSDEKTQAEDETDDIDGGEIEENSVEIAGQDEQLA